MDHANQLIKVGDAHSAIHYGKLVLAVGADVIRPPIEGDALEMVYSVNDLADYADFRTAVEKNDVGKVCIIGAGLIGCEYTNDLLNGGFEVEVVDPLGYCLPTLLPEPAGRAVQAALEEKGATFHFGPLVTQVSKGERGVVVTLDNGETIDADLVISAVGVRPRTDLASASGLETERGIVTNRLLETSAPNVYAMGDCAEVNGHVLVYVAPLMAAAKALGKTLAGEPTEVTYPAMPVTIKTPACPVVVSPPAPGAEGEWTVEEEGNSVNAQFRDGAGNLLGFALTGEATKQKLSLQKELPPILA
ncbi:MAG: FAD-dependent oxidoreductase [Halioglobus sp.]|nr:FAD-dependent oxidoreductase [Halioglobus sp.]